MAISKSMYLIQICIYIYFFFFFYRTHFGSPARRKAGMRKNSVTESQNGDALRGVAVKPQLKAKGHHTFEGKLQFPFVSNCHYLTSFELIFDNYF